jgi:acyl carrier protein
MGIFKFLSKRKEDIAKRETKRQEIFLKVKEVLIEQLGVLAKIDITLHTRLVADLGVDSLDTVELVMKLEEKFSIEIPDEDAELMKTVKDVVDYIENAILKN